MRKHDAIASARWRYIISYILVSVLPLLFCAGFILYGNYQINRSQLEDAMLDRLELVKTQLDLTFQKLESAGMYFASSGIWKDHESEEVDNPISKQLDAFREDLSFVEDAVYLPVGKPYIFTPRRRMPYTEFCDLKDEQFSLNLSSFFMHMNTLTDSMLLPTHRTTQRFVDGGRVLFLHPIPLLEASREGAIAFFIREHTIYAMFEESFFDTAGYYYILDQNMGVVYTNETGNMADAFRTRMSRLRGTGLFHQEVDAQDYVLMRTVSDTSGAYYMAAIPANVFYAQVGYLQGNQAMALLFSLLLVTVFSVALALFFYRPLEQFLRSLSAQTAVPISGHAQGLQQAGKHLLQISADRAALFTQLNDHHQVLLRQLVSGLLQGQLHESGVSHLLDQLQLAWQGNGFIALHAWIAERPESMLPLERWHIPQGDVYAIHAEQADQIALLADVNLTPGQGTEALRAHVAQACRQCLEQAGCRQIRLGVGSYKVQAMALSASHLEAQSLGRDLLEIESPPVALFRPSATGNLSNSFLPLAEKALLVQCLINGNTKAALETLDQLNNNLRAFSGNRTLMRSVFFYLYDAMVTAGNSLQLSVPRNALDQGLASVSLEDFTRALRGYIEAACAQVERRRQHSASYTQHRILQYVNEHFREHTLSMDELCDRFDLSASYLARFFKQETGYSFLQYTGQLRMDYVKVQLTQSQKPIKDIVLEAGYLDPASFIRKFRQQEGMTPGEYRANMSKRDQ